MAHKRHTKAGLFYRREDGRLQGHDHVKFLEAVRIVAPVVLRGLLECLPIYARDPKARLGGPLRQAIEEWARPHCLTKDGKPPRWIMQTAKFTLFEWHRKPPAPGAPLNWHHHVAVGWSVLPEKKTLVSVPIAWDPTLELRPNATLRIHAEIEAVLDQIEEMAADAGAQRIPKVQDEHFRWAALVQCANVKAVNVLSPNTKAAADSPTRRVNDAVHDVIVDRCGLDRRPEKSGRKPKSGKRASSSRTSQF